MKYLSFEPIFEIVFGKNHHEIMFFMKKCISE